jgi:hypothetical protein
LYELKKIARVTCGHAIRLFRGGKASPTASEFLSRYRAQSFLQRPLVFHRHQEVEGSVELNMLKQFRCQMFQVRHHQRFARLGCQYLRGQFQQFDRGGRCRACRGGGGETDRLMRVGIEGKEGRGHFEGPTLLVVAITPHQPLAITADAMRIDSQQFADVIARCAADSSQGNLQPLRFRHGVFRE